MDPQKAIGRPPEDLSLTERTAFAGKIIALEIYSPQTLPVRRIEAIGDSPEECARALMERGLDPRKFELISLAQPY